MPMDSFRQVTVQGSAITARAYHSTVIHRGWLYVVMGFNGAARLRCSFCTNNGTNWRQRDNFVDTKGNGIAPRDSFGLCAHNEKIYLLGGWNGATRYRHVYVTSDMVRWTRLQDAPWTARYGFYCCSFNGCLWVIGGSDASGNLNDVWWTRDGVSWIQENNAPWAIRRYMGGIVYNNRIYIIGGFGASYYNDVYYTDDGRNWARMENNAAFPARGSHAVESFGAPKLVMVGGQGTSNAYYDDLWHSGAGNQWFLGDNVIPMGSLRGHSMDFFNNRLVVVGGINGAATYRNQVWEANTQMFKV